MADPDQALGSQSKKGAPKRIHIFNYPSFFVTIIGYHTKVVTISRPRKWLFLLVELCDLSGNHYSLKSPFIITKTLKQVAKKDPIFHKLHITEYAMGVPNNLLFLQ